MQTCRACQIWFKMIFSFKVVPGSPPIFLKLGMKLGDNKGKKIAWPDFYKNSHFGDFGQTCQSAGEKVTSLHAFFYKHEAYKHG